MMDELCLRTGPFTNHSPFIGISQPTPGVTCGLVMLCRIPAHIALTEDLIDVRVQYDMILRRLGAHEPVPS